MLYKPAAWSYNYAKFVETRSLPMQKFTAKTEYFYFSFSFTGYYCGKAVSAVEASAARA